MSVENNKAELLLRYVDGTLTHDKLLQVEEMLAQDDDARAILRSIAEQAVVIADDARVKDAARSSPVRDVNLVDITKIAKRKNRALQTLLGIAALIIVALSTGLIHQLSQSGQEQNNSAEAKIRGRDTNPFVAKISGASGPLIWTGDRGQIVRDMSVGTELAGGTIEGLAPGSWFKLEFRDGSTVTISGTSLLTFADIGQKKLRLREGRLSASVKPQSNGKPMLVNTRSALLKVLGTQFDVEANLSSTLLTVSEGKVNLRRLSDGREVEVPAKHQVTTDTEDELLPTRTPESVHEWKSQLHLRPQNYGKWQAATDNSPASLKAIPLIPPNLPEITLYLAGLSVDRPNGSPVVISPGSKFVVRGRLRTNTRVYLGIRVNHSNGEFAGMFRGDHAENQPTAVTDQDGRFEEIYKLQDFWIDPAVLHRQNELVARPDGLILADIWAFTHTDTPSGLEITEVEVIPPSRALSDKDPAQR